MILNDPYPYHKNELGLYHRIYERTTAINDAPVAKTSLEATDEKEPETHK